MTAVYHRGKVTTHVCKCNLVQYSLLHACTICGHTSARQSNSIDAAIKTTEQEGEGERESERHTRCVGSKHSLKPSGLYLLRILLQSSGKTTHRHSHTTSRCDGRLFRARSVQ